jgi:hypothetical protein
MKNLDIISIGENIMQVSLDQVSEMVENISVPYISVDTLNWIRYNYKPQTFLKLVHFGNGLFLHFKVEESNIRALVDADNGPVYTDSCVEFFIDPVGDGTYYNFEFNCIGNLLLGFGKTRHNRELAPQDVLQLVNRLPGLGTKPIAHIGGPQWWELLIFIPFSAFFKHTIRTLTGLNPRGNFYKCGDLNIEPHYVTWNPIETNVPDFHRPEFFGTITLV